MRVRVLGAAAGGGFPQWNSNSAACRRVRSGDSFARPATQASIAVSADGRDWLIVNASPDLRQQIEANPCLHPQEGLRSTPIAAVVLTNADVDAIAGLLNLRERTAFALHAHPRILSVLEANPIFNVLAPGVVRREPFDVGQPAEIAGLTVEAFPVPGKVALFLEKPEAGADFGTQEGDTIGLEMTDPEGRRLLYIANCAAVTLELKARCAGADALFFDGTLWHDDELIARNEGSKTGQRMGHISMSGPDGAMVALADVDTKRKIFIHINNTNPALLGDSAERREIEAAGWEVAFDGMELSLGRH